MKNYLKQKGIKHELTIPYTPEQNGKAERFNRTLIEGIRCLLHQSQLSVKWWGEAAATVSFLLNYTSIVEQENKTSYQVWTGHEPDFERLRLWGCIAYAHIPKEKRTKLDENQLEEYLLDMIYNPKHTKLTIPKQELLSYHEM